jgi:hypothetical protein
MMQQPLQDRGDQDLIVEDVALVAKPLLLVTIKLPRSQRRTSSRKNRLASSRKHGRYPKFIEIQ